MRIRVIAGLLGLGLSAASTAGTFIAVNQPGSQLVSLSEHGRIASGSFSGQGAFRWTRANGGRTIDGYAGIQGMNSWGQPVAGQAQDASQNWVAALAYSNAGLVDPVLIGGLPGGVALDGMLSAAYDSADDGSVVGLAYTADNAVAFRWHAATGMAELPRIDVDSYARANAVSRDGRVIIGWNDTDEGYRRAVKWVDGQVQEMLDAQGQQVGEALGTNRDGSVIVGGGAGKDGKEAWRWTAATGLQPIGLIPTGSFFDQGYAFGVSDDGNLVGGASGAGPMRKAVVWTPQTGMILLTDFLAARGITVPAGWTLNSVTAVSGDGKVIGGWGFDPDSAVNSFVIELDTVPVQPAILEARGKVVWNDLASGPFAAVAVETPVTMSFRMTPDGFEIEPGQFMRYPIDLSSFRLQAGAASDVLADGERLLGLANDYPKSDGIHLFDTPLVTPATSMEFELFNPGGDLFDSAELNNINRTFTPQMFEKASWVVAQNGGAFSMMIELESVTIEDECAIFCGDFD
jgi:probable HAF family extracellular repeat protein